MTDDQHRPGGGARGYSWPPFQPGHELRLEHGARSTRRVTPIAERYAAALAEVAPWTASPAFTGTVRSWAWAEGQAELLRAFLDEHGHFDAEGQERGAVRTYDRVEGRLAKMRDQLGLTPASAMKVLQTAADLAATTGNDDGLRALQAEGARILEGRLAQVDDDTTEGPDDDQ